MSNELTTRKKAWVMGGKVTMKLEEDEGNSHANSDVSQTVVYGKVYITLLHHLQVLVTPFNGLGPLHGVIYQHLEHHYCM